ncbi:MAG: CAP domain-containing protein [Anaerovoracaceae bacterium]
MKKKFLMAALALCIAAGSADAGFGLTAEKGISFGGICKIFSLNCGQSVSGTVKSSGSTGATGSTGTVSSVNSMEKQVASLTNSERKAAGLGSLTLDSQLSKLARMKAEDMAKNGYFSHTSPTYGSAFDMMKQYGVSYRTAGENIAKGQKTAESVMNGWMNSSGHRANILSSTYTHIGVGYAKDSKGNTYWVQVFKG